jgi:hypothetical protein
MIIIDGYDIYNKWTLKPTFEGLYNSLMKQPDIKDRVVGDYSTKSGIEIISEVAKVKSGDVTLSFFCNSFAKYREFLKYVIEHPVIEMYVGRTGDGYFLEYQKCSSFNDYRDYNVFSVTFRQANPLNLSIAYLNTESGFRLITESGLNLII